MGSNVIEWKIPLIFYRFFLKPSLRDPCSIDIIKHIQEGNFIKTQAMLGLGDSECGDSRGDHLSRLGDSLELRCEVAGG